jgi:putative ABC transport system substrate-binding protein
VIENRPGASSNIATSAVVRAAPDPFHYYAVDGGLISYGPDVPDQFRLAAGYVDRVLRSERSSKLPVVQSTKFELVINLNTAKALGLTIPETLLATADEVIQ